MVSTPLLKLSLCKDNVELKYIVETWRFDVQICNLSLDLRWIFWVCSMQICMRLLCVLRRFVCVHCRSHSSIGRKPKYRYVYTGREIHHARNMLLVRDYENMLRACNYADFQGQRDIMPKKVLASSGHPKQRYTRECRLRAGYKSLVRLTGRARRLGPQKPTGR